MADVGATIRWYEKQLGFEGHRFPENEPHVFGILVRDQVEIMLQRIEGYRSQNFTISGAVGCGMPTFACEV